MKIEKYFWMFLTKIILMFHYTFCSNQSGIRAGVGDEFLLKTAQFIVDRKMTHLFQRSGVRLILVDGTEGAYSLIQILQRISPIPAIILEQEGVSNINRRAWPSIVLFFLQDENKLQESIEYLQKIKLHETYVPAVMVKLTKVNDEKQFDVSTIMKTAWNNGLIRFMLIYCHNDMKAYSYNPFSNTIMDTSNKTGEDLFQEIRFNMHGYLWRVSLFEEWPLLEKRQNGNSHEWFGRDYILLKQTARLLNATFEIVEPPANTKYKGAIQDIMNKKADFCFVKRFPDFDIKNVRFVNIISLSSLNVIVKKSPYRQKSTSITLVFQRGIWFFIIFSLVILSVTLKFSLREKQGLFDSFLDIWKVLLNVSLQTTRRQKYKSVILLLVWIWSSLILNVSFQCRLIDLMKYPQFEKGIESFEDLERSKLPVYTSYDYVKMQGGTGYLTDQMHLVPYEEVLEVLDDASSNIAVVMPFILRRGEVSSRFFDYLETRGKIILDQDLIESYAMYTFPDFSPFRTSVNLAILKQIEFGLMEMLPFVRYKRDFKTAIQSTFKLNLRHVVSPFQFLFVGLTLSLFIFVLEISSVHTGQSKL